MRGEDVTISDGAGGGEAGSTGGGREDGERGTWERGRRLARERCIAVVGVRVHMQSASASLVYCIWHCDRLSVVRRALESSGTRSGMGGRRAHANAIFVVTDWGEKLRFSGTTLTRTALVAVVSCSSLLLACIACVGARAKSAESAGGRGDERVERRYGRDKETRAEGHSCLQCGSAAFAAATGFGKGSWWSQWAAAAAAQRVGGLRGGAGEECAKSSSRARPHGGRQW